MVINNICNAYAYFTDCTLATVSWMSSIKSRSDGEYKRQINIAQKQIDYALRFSVDLSETRAQEIINDYGGKVDLWAIKHDVKNINLVGENDGK
jgi:hypothetical protein